MHVIKFLANGSFTVADTFSTGHKPPQADTQRNGTYDIMNASLSQINSKQVVTYYRQLNTKDPNDFVFDVNATCSLIIAWGNGTLSYHQHNYKFTEFKISDKPSHGKNKIIWTYWDFHGIGFAICWTLFTLIGYISIRFYKHLNSGIITHLIFSGTASLFTIGICIYSIILGNLINNNIDIIIFLF